MERIKPPVVSKVKSVRKIMRPLTGCDSKPPLHQWDYRYRALVTGLTSGGTSRHSITVDGGGGLAGVQGHIGCPPPDTHL